MLSCLKRKALAIGKESSKAYLVQGESGLATHVLEQQLGDLQLLPKTGVVQGRVAPLQAEGQKNRI